MSEDTWRVLCEEGTRDVVVEERGCVGDGRRQYAVSGVYIVDVSARMAVTRWCAMEAHALPVREILAPGEFSAEDRVAAERARCAKVCRDIARAYLDDINGAGFPRHSGAHSVADGCADAIEGKVTP